MPFRVTGTSLDSIAVGYRQPSGSSTPRDDVRGRQVPLIIVEGEEMNAGSSLDG